MQSGAYIISIENAHHYGNILPQVMRLRNQEFKERQNYQVPVFKDMEYDDYDTPAAVYAIYLDENGIARGCTRMSPTDRPYMIQAMWPSMITDIDLPAQHDIWESTRFCIDSTLPAPMRQKIKLEILQAKIEYCLAAGIQGLIGVMPTLIWRAVFTNSGWPIKHIGQITEIESGEKVVAAWIPVYPEILKNIQTKRQTTHYILDTIKDINLLLERNIEQKHIQIEVA